MGYWLIAFVFNNCGKHVANLSIGPKTGTGRCFFRTSTGNYIAPTDPRQYAAARLISNGTVQRPVRAVLIYYESLQMLMFQ